MARESTKLKIVNWLLRLLGRIGKNISIASRQLRFLKYQLMFGEREDDIYVCTYAKSGTTLLQMILYQLTTDGNMDFGHIYEVSPWLRNASFEDNGVPENLPSPRIIKSHDPYEVFYKGHLGRFICVTRDPADLVVSLYHHRRNYNDPNATMDEVFKSTFIENKETVNWFDYQLNWLTNRHGHNILYLRYEDLVNDIDGSLQNIVKFLGLNVSEEVITRTKERSSFAFMKAHETKFGEQPRQNRVYNQFIRKGKAGEGKEMLNPQQLQGLQDMYALNLKPLESKFANTHLNTAQLVRADA